MIGGVTISDVARVACCNKSTASRALRYLPGVDPKKAEMIRAVARQLGYQPDPVQSMAAAHRWKSPGRLASHTVAFLFCDLGDDISVCEGWRNRQKQLSEIAREQLERNGSHFEIFSLGDYRKASALARILKARGIRGIIVPPLSPASQEFLEGFEWEAFSSVALKTGWVVPPCHSVDIDEWAGVHWAWKELRTRGYERIGFAPARHDIMAVDDFIRHGACFSICSSQPEYCPTQPYLGLINDKEAFLAWVKKEKPDAIIAFGNQMHDWLKEAGHDIPEKMGVVSLHVNAREEISGLTSDFEGLTAAAMDFLMSEIRNNHWGIPIRIYRTLLAPVWNEGTTVRALPAKIELDPAIAATAPVMPPASEEEGGLISSPAFEDD